MTKISVITVNYNDKAGLEKTLQSVTSQTLQDFEYVVIDGGSKDGSKELIESYSDKIDYWVSEPDKGVYSAMNKGIKAATGEFVIFMNGGDLFSDNQVLENVRKSLVPEYDIYYGNCNRIYEKGVRKRTFPKILSFSFFYTSTLNHQSTFIRKTLFDDIFLYNEDYKIVSDWEFFIYAICHKNVPYKYLDVTISDFDFTGISSNQKNSQIADDERIMTLKKYFPLFVEDYSFVSELNSKRARQFFYIKKFSMAWQILKAVLSVILIFLPKEKR